MDQYTSDHEARDMWLVISVIAVGMAAWVIISGVETSGIKSDIKQLSAEIAAHVDGGRDAK